MPRHGVTVTDWKDIGWNNLGDVLEKILGHDHTVEVNYDVPFGTWPRKDGTFPPVALVTFDSDHVRDPWVHGWCVDAGYIAAISF